VLKSQKKILMKENCSRSLMMMQCTRERERKRERKGKRIVGIDSISDKN
jgi:hypothetical protein